MPREMPPLPSFEPPEFPSKEPQMPRDNADPFNPLPLKRDTPASPAGLGGIAADTVPVTKEYDPTRAIIKELDARLDALDDRTSDLTHLDEEHQQRLQLFQTSLEQLQRQVPLIEAACVQYRDALITMGQRLDLLARQQQGNLRMAAMSLAAQSRQPAEPRDRIVQHAEAYYDFLRKQDEPPAAAPSGNTAQPDESVEQLPPATPI